MPEVAAQLELARGRLGARKVLQRRLARPQLLQLMLGEVPDHQPVAFETAARERCELAGNRLDQRGLAGAIGAQQSQPCAGLQSKLQVLEDRTARVAQRGVLQREQRRRRAPGRRDLEIEWRIHVRGCHALEPVERLETALRLPGLAGLGAEAGDETTDVGDLALLTLEHRLLHGEPSGALLFERRVVARIKNELSCLDVRDVRDAGIEEVAIVRYHEQGAAIGREPALEPHHGIEVQVVGGFVEQQQVGAAQQRVAQVEPHAPAAGEVRHRPLQVGRREAEPVQHRRSARPGGIAVDGLQASVCLGEAVAVVGVAGGGDRPLDVPQFDVAVEHELDRGLRQRGRFLADGRDVPVARHHALAGFRVQFTAQQREQARLAAAVRADHAHAPAGVQLQVRMLDQAPGAAGERQLPKLDQFLRRIGSGGRAF